MSVIKIGRSWALSRSTSIILCMKQQFGSLKEVSLIKINLQFPTNYLILLKDISISRFCSLYDYRWWINGNIKLHYLSKKQPFSVTLHQNLPEITYRLKSCFSRNHHKSEVSGILCILVCSNTHLMFYCLYLDNKLITSMQTLRIISLCFKNIGGNSEITVKLITRRFFNVTLWDILCR